MSKKAFGTTSKGVEASLYEISNAGGLRVLLTDYGATVVSIFVKDRDGNERDVILGYDDVKSYEKEYSYFGATVGRYANRISDAKINIDGVEYKLEANDNENNLHSGSNGVSKRFWTVKEQKDDEITFEIEDADLEQGFPGNAVIDVTFKVTGENALAITYNAKADKTTTFNMTNHSYFNLNGGGTAMEHTLTLAAETYLETSPGCLPTGRALPVAGTPFDFRTAKPVGRDIDAPAEQLRLVNGYDHHFCVNGGGLRQAAVLRGDRSGITMTLDTTSPGVQLYTANWLSRRNGKGGAVYEPRCAVCLEPQFPPDAVHHPAFPQPLLRKGEVYRHCTIYTFSK